MSELSIAASRSVLALLPSAYEQFRIGQSAMAAELCEQILVALPAQADALFLNAVISAQAKSYLRANVFFERAIAASPERADFFGNYGNALWEQGCFAEAVAQCRQSLRLDANRPEVHNTLGNALLAQDRLDEACGCFRDALAAEPCYAAAENNLGKVLQLQGKSEEALTHYQRAIQLKGDYAEAYNNLGTVHKDAGRISEAEQAFHQALLIKPDYINAQRHLAQVDAAWLLPLDGRHVQLRRAQSSDVDFLLQCYGNAAFMDRYHLYIPRRQSWEQLSRKLRQDELRHPCQSGSLDWLILKNETAGGGASAVRPIGVANLVDIQFGHRRAEFLIGIPETADRSGSVGLEATLLVMDFAFNRVGLNKLTTYVYGNNQASQNNTLALGFVQESLLREQLSIPASDLLIDLYGNGMTLADFRCNTRLARLSRRLLGRDITQLN